MIELKHLCKTYAAPDKEIHALEDINLTIRDGEIFGIIGLSGAGKSTLVRCINLLEIPTSGQVLVDGKDLTQLPRKELLLLRRSIGMIFQSFNLLEQRSVLRNVCFPLEISGVERKSAEKKARELLQIVGLADRADSYPSQLSGGQKQRVAIARALATDPKYILCDEATSALDPNTTRAILDLLRQINRDLGVTIIVITHEMKVIDQICDRVAVIDRSRIAEEGRVSEVRQLFPGAGHLQHGAGMPGTGQHPLCRHQGVRGRHLRAHDRRAALRPQAGGKDPGLAEKQPGRMARGGVSHAFGYVC